MDFPEPCEIWLQQIAHRSLILLTAWWQLLRRMSAKRDNMHSKKEMTVVGNKQNAVILQVLGSLKLCP